MDTTYLPLNVTVPTGQVMILSGAGTYARYYPTSQRVDPTSASVTNAQIGPFTEETVWRLTPSAGGIGYDINIPLDSLATELTAAQVDAVQAMVSGGGIRTLLAKRIGSLAVPLASVTLSGATGAFVLPVVPTLPANTLAAGGRVLFNMHFRRRTNVGAATLNVRLGTAGGSGDSEVFTVSVGATTNQDLRIDVAAGFSTLTRFTTTSWLQANGAGSTNPAVDRTTNVNLAAEMRVSADLSGGSSGDTFDLISYSVWSESAGVL